MENFFNNIVSSIGLNDVLDIAIVAFLVYKSPGGLSEKPGRSSLQRDWWYWSSVLCCQISLNSTPSIGSFRA